LNLVKSIEQGKLTVTEVKKIYQVSSSAVYKWLQKYSQLYANNHRVIVESKSLSKKYKEQSERIKELERALGQKQMKIDYLEKLIETASSRLGEDIEKKTKRLL
jgi:transposase